MSIVSNIAARAAAAMARPQALAGLDLLASAVVLVDGQGHITFANAAASISVQRMGAGPSMPTTAEVAAVLGAG